MSGLEIHELARRGRLFESTLQDAKKNLAPAGIPWYPYDTFAALSVADKLLTGRNRFLLDLAGGDPVLDLGCGDGGLAFFFESLGCEVHAMDHPHSNHNGMRGVTELRRALNSSVTLHAVDLDSQFYLPEESFGLAVFLGVLYHLKNPFYALETLATHARYCLLSTRIAQVTPKATSIQNEPVAYLLGPGEANNDPTNFWIFSEAGLRRLCDRTGWNVVSYTTSGCARRSDPAHADRDERAYCLLESRVCARYSVKLLDGWHPLEQSSFRWTARNFSVELRKAPAFNVSKLRFKFHLPSEAIAARGPITLTASVNGTAAPPATFASEGDHSLTVDLQPKISERKPLKIDFVVDKCLPAGQLDGRELGVIVPFWRQGIDAADPLVPFELF